MSVDGVVAEAAERTCARIGAYAHEVIRHAPVPGGVIVLADRRRRLAERTFGYADLERGQPTRLGHLFEIGSISKVFTSLLAGQFAAEARLSLDDPVTDLLPWLDLGGGARPATTLRALLSHTAGLALGSDALPDDLAQVWRLRDLTAATSQEHFHYSNLGFLILGLALSARAGERLPDLVRDRLLGPMGMADSIPAVTHDDRARLAVGYTAARQDRPWVPGDPLAPATWFEVAGADGNIAATGPDLARLVMLLLGRGEVAGRRVVAESVIETMMTSLAPDGEPVAQLPGVPPVTSSRYGLGVNVETIAGNRCLTHGGGMVGYSTFMLADISAEVGVVVLTNADGDSLHAQMLARAAHADLLSRLSGVAEPDLPPADPRVRRQGAAAASAVPLGRFLAADPLDRPAAMTLREDPDGVVVASGEREGRLYQTLSGRYVTDHPDLRQFPLDQVMRDGQPAWLHGPVVYRGEEAGTRGPDGQGAAGRSRRASRASGAEVPAAWQALAGHYRCYSPWYPAFRVFIRDGALWLAAAGGVEAPSQEERLVEVGTGIYRIGAEDWLPERLVAGPTVGGEVISVDRDGCAYSRAFTP